MTDLTTEQWIEILLYDAMLTLPIPITMAEYELQIERITEIMGEM
jgi:hypothetical protein